MYVTAIDRTSAIKIPATMLTTMPRIIDFFDFLDFLCCMMIDGQDAMALVALGVVIAPEQGVTTAAIGA